MWDIDQSFPGATGDPASRVATSRSGPGGFGWFGSQNVSIYFKVVSLSVLRASLIHFNTAPWIRAQKNYILVSPQQSETCNASHWRPKKCRTERRHSPRFDPKARHGEWIAPNWIHCRKNKHRKHPRTASISLPAHTAWAALLTWADNPKKLYKRVQIHRHRPPR